MITVEGQKPAQPATGIDLSHDVDLGVTNPNLHRRVYPQEPPHHMEVAPRSYSIGIYGTHSYRTTTKYTYDENQDFSEVP